MATFPGKLAVPHTFVISDVMQPVARPFLNGEERDRCFQNVLK